MSTEAPARPGSTKATPPVASSWIPEVQGLRTLALLLVATFHIWFDRVSGGVDIFLLISAFLMTRSLYGVLERGAPLRPLQTIVQRFGRLMPLAIGVAAVTLAVSVFVLPLSRLEQYVQQFFASSLYVENLWLQDAAVDYFASGDSLASPFQHYWSLSVQGQIFIIWPFLFLLIFAVRKVTRLPLRPLALGVFGTILVAGLAWSTYLTLVNQPYAYFDLWARAWEFAAGSVLALVMPWMRFGPAVRSVLTWLGIAGAVLCGIVIPVDGTFPGLAALWPVVSAALVIVGAGAPTRFGGDRLLSHPVMTRLGGYTYALYLVHWPVLIFGMALLQTPRPNFFEGTLILLVSGVLSVVAVHVIEKPFSWFTRSRAPRDSSWRRGLPWRAALVVVLLPAVAFVMSSQATTYIAGQREAAHTQVAEADLSVLGPNATPAALEIPPDAAIPSSWTVSGDIGYLYPCAPEMLPNETRDRAMTHCQSNINVVDRTRAERSIYVVGNSHAQQVGQLVSEVAAHEGWALRAYFMFGCQFDLSELDDAAAAECEQMWSDATVDILENRPDAVVVLGSYSTGPDTEREFTQLPAWIEEVRATGAEVIVVRDNPRSDLNMVDCGEQWGYGNDLCQWSTELTTPNVALAAEVEAAGGVYLDPNSEICPNATCRPAYGGLVIYFDSSHVSATYMRALAYTTAPTIAASIPWWPETIGTAGAA